MEKPLGRYFQVQCPYCQAAQCKQKTPITTSSGWQVRSEKTKKGLIILDRFHVKNKKVVAAHVRQVIVACNDVMGIGLGRLDAGCLGPVVVL